MYEHDLFRKPVSTFRDAPEPFVVSWNRSAGGNSGQDRGLRRGRTRCTTKSEGRRTWPEFTGPAGFSAGGRPRCRASRTMNHIAHSTPSWRIASPAEKQNCFHLNMKGSGGETVLLTERRGEGPIPEPRPDTADHLEGVAGNRRPTCDAEASRSRAARRLSRKRLLIALVTRAAHHENWDPWPATGFVDTKTRC